jgi:hypothetical protein
VYCGAPGVADRSAGITVVVANDESRGGREALAELLLPEKHRAARSHDEKDSCVGGITEGVDAELDPVDPDDLLVPLHGTDHQTFGGRPRASENGSSGKEMTSATSPFLIRSTRSSAPYPESARAPDVWIVTPARHGNRSVIL